MQSIRAWLAAHPERGGRGHEAQPLLHLLRRRDGGEGPLGAQGVPLTAGRSLAVDPRFIPFGVPVWLDTAAPVAGGDGPLAG